MKIFDLRNQLIELQKNVMMQDEAAFNADQLLKHVLKIDAIKLHQNFSSHADEIVIKTCMELNNKLIAGKPLQYVLGYAYFYGHCFKVNPSVLIPRPETEELVNLIVKHYKPNRNKMQVMDIGTGSGCIAISIKKVKPSFEVTAMDISSEALQVAMHNAQVIGAEINFIQDDIVNVQSNLPCFDMIVSNPPYVMFSERAEMLPNVLDNEPHLALFTPDDALFFYKHILQFAKTNLKTDGSIWFEINPLKAYELIDLMQPNYHIKLLDDMFGKHRMIFGIKKNIDL